MPHRTGSRHTYNGYPYVLGSQNLLIYATSGTTSSAGALTFTLPAGLFTSVVGVTATVIRDSTNPTQAAFAMVRSYSATSVVIQVFESKTTSLGMAAEGLAATTTVTTVALTVFGA